MKKEDKLNILYRNKVILEMTLEDLEIWKEFNNIYPSYLRFPESVGWNNNSTIHNRKKCVGYLKMILKRVDKYINQLITHKSPKVYRSKEMSLFIKERNKMLKVHLKKLKEVRNKRLKEEKNEKRNIK